MLIGSKEPSLQIPDLDDDIDDFEDEDDEKKEEEKHLDMPASWVKSIEITEKDYESRLDLQFQTCCIAINTPFALFRCPLGKKTILYKKAKLEKYAPYLLKEGLVLRLSVYSDNESEKLSLLSVICLSISHT